MKRALCSGVDAHVTGHGLCVRLSLLEKLPFPARSPLEDMHYQVGVRGGLADQGGAGVRVGEQAGHVGQGRVRHAGEGQAGAPLHPGLPPATIRCIANALRDSAAEGNHE
ncbi:MAG TPA: hypothetical protein VMV07_20760 [Streptosporangiaceae bacterium]|nr:hypothetical protein [Streptosporangiaceae bacterium]